MSKPDEPKRAPEKRPLTDAEREILLEMYGVSRDTFQALQDAPPSLSALIKAGMA